MVSNDDGIEHHEDILKSQLLAAESMWDLLAVLTRVYAGEENKELDKAISDARWAVVKDLLHPDKRNFLPFELSIPTPGNLLPDYIQWSNYYMQHVLRRIAAFSKWWRPSKDIIEIIVKQLWESEVSDNPDEIIQLPELLKQFAIRCRELGNSRLQLAAFAESCRGDDESDFTATLCKIIWIQLLKFEKRVHRVRFCGSILSFILSPPEMNGSATSPPVASKSSGTNWIWGPNSAPTTTQPAKPQPTVELQQPSPSANSRKDRTRTAVLLTFAVVSVCLECGDEQRFPSDRVKKDVRYMEREIDFYCTEFLRWTSVSLHCDVIVAQALYTLGALLLERNSTEFPIIFRSLNDRLEVSVKNLHDNLPAIPTPKEMTSTNANASKNRALERRRRRLQSKIIELRCCVSL
ncbi:hypothetical protein PR003_g1085 [Phytophthora rubi]|uniref:Uncharacterized protein n=1 Tax=Phytophthora rubi TaxID=129364 RepID=A0A6A4FWC4_9STRA|nr:hypothetical protein PR003_g1085 [Phytophthora rubi]